LLYKLRVPSNLLTVCISSLPTTYLSANMAQGRITKILLERFGCEAYITYTLAEAVEQIQTVLFDMVVLDGYSFRTVRHDNLSKCSTVVFILAIGKVFFFLWYFNLNKYSFETLQPRLASIEIQRFPLSVFNSFLTHLPSHFRQTIVGAVRELRRSSFRNYIIIVSDGHMNVDENTLVEAGADGTISPTQIGRIEALIEFARNHGSRSRHPLRVIFLDADMVWR